MSEGALLQLREKEGGRVVELSLDAGKGQVLSRKVIEQLDQAFAALKDKHQVHAVILTAEGNDFSFGASVPEHAPGEVETMLPAFSRLFRTIASSAVPICAAVRGRCFGGGLELALAAHHIVVADDAKLGVPEVTLGVFPPVAAAVLPWRVPQPVADRLIMTGEIIDGRTAAALGLADESCGASEVLTAARKWTQPFLGLSGVAIRYATRASRAAWDESLGVRLERLEQMYLKELMATEDAREGIQAFLDRRKPAWVDR